MGIFDEFLSRAEKYAPVDPTPAPPTEPSNALDPYLQRADRYEMGKLIEERTELQTGIADKIQLDLDRWSKLKDQISPETAAGIRAISETNGLPLMDASAVFAKDQWNEADLIGKRMLLWDQQALYRSLATGKLSPTEFWRDTVALGATDGLWAGYKELGRSVVVDPLQQVPSGAVSMIGLGVEGLGALVGAAERSVARPLAAIGIPIDPNQEFAGEQIYNYVIGDINRQYTQRIADAIGVSPERRTVMTDIGQGVGSFVGLAATYWLGGGLASTTGMLGVGAGQQVQSIEEARSRTERTRGVLGDLLADDILEGLDGMKADGSAYTLAEDMAILVGAAGEAALEKIGGVEKILGTFPNAFRSSLVRILASTGAEGVTEGLQQIAQNSVTKLFYDEEKGVFDDAAYEAFIGAIIGGGAGVLTGSYKDGTMRFVQSDELAMKRQLADVNSKIEALQATRLAVEESQTFQLDPIAVRDLIQEAGDQDVSLPAEEVDALYQAGFISDADLEALQVSDSIQQMAAVGGDIVVPASVLLTLPDSDFAQLSRHIRTSPETPTVAEAEASLAAQDEEVKRLTTELQSALNTDLEGVDKAVRIGTEIKTTAPVIEDQLVTQLGIPREEAAPQANLIASRYAVRAADMDNVTALQLLEADQLEFQRGAAPQLPQAPMTQAPTMEQPEVDTTSPAFRAWFGDSKVVDDTGAPLMMYHATDADFTAFDADHIGKTDAGFFGRGFSFSSQPEYAASYLTEGAGKIFYDPSTATSEGDNIIPVHLSMQNPFRISLGVDVDLNDRVGVLRGIKAAIYGMDEVTSADPAEAETIAKALLEEATGAVGGDVKTVTSEYADQLTAMLEARGYDGVIVDTNSGDQAGPQRAVEALVFDPTQIKSPFNRGTFDPASPSILEQPLAGLEPVHEALQSGRPMSEIAELPEVRQAVADMTSRPPTVPDDVDAAASIDYSNRSYQTADGKALSGVDELLTEYDAVSGAYAGEAVRQDKQVQILLGPPAAGKSTIAETIAPDMGARIIDADDIKKMIPEFDGGIGAAATHEESSLLTKMSLEDAISRGDNIVLPKVGGNPDSIKSLMEVFKAAGYEVNLINMAVDPAEAERRNLARFASTGRLVPPSYVASIGDAPTTVYNTLKGEADGFAEYDNNVAFGTPAVIREDTRRGALAGPAVAGQVGAQRSGEAVGGRADGQQRGAVAGQVTLEQQPVVKGPTYTKLPDALIPENTRTTYKLMKVQKSRPHEVLPLFAKPKGASQGFTFNEWYVAEEQRPTIGNKQLALRAGLHAVDKPVFDQGKAKKKGETRVWVEVEIPVASAEAQAESDRSPILANGMRTGINQRLIGPSESYDFKTNPNASEDAAGWPIAGSMKVLRVLSDAEVTRILTEAGLENQIDNSMTGIDAAEAASLGGQSLDQMSPFILEQMAARQDAAEGETTNVPMPTRLSEAAVFARDNRFATGRDLKLRLQEIALDGQKGGMDLTKLTDEVATALSDFVVADALTALEHNSNAVGWYDANVSEALDTLATKYPEINTDEEARFAFVWALAVTSNGLKVNKNFELAEKAYVVYRETKSFPTDIGIGTAAGAINKGLRLYDHLIDRFGNVDALREFMTTERTAKEIEALSGVAVSGEHKATRVRGSAILGSKIGEGFFSNLYGYYDALTMDRWLMRTVGRWRGTLIEARPDMVAKKRASIKELMAGLSKTEITYLQGFFNGTDIKLAKRMGDARIDALAKEVAKRSTAKSWRSHISAAAGGNQLRLLGNSLTGYLDGQVEQPTAAERNFLRSVFRQGLDRLRANNDLKTLTMADLQALLWYPEKLLYDTAKKPQGEEVLGYADEEAPNYANAARLLVHGKRPDAVGSGSGSREGIVLEQGFATLDEGGAEVSGDRGETLAPSSLVQRLAGLEGQPRLVEAAEYSAAMKAAAAHLGPEAAQVSTVPADSTAYRVLLDDGLTGFALDGDNVIGVFSTPNLAPRGASQRVLSAATKMGGRRLDGFNTYLPKLYARSGFKAVARLPFNPEYAPSVEDGALANWDAEGMEALHEGWGAPDVSFMVYDPANASADTDNVVADYDDGIAAQDAALPRSPLEQSGPRGAYVVPTLNNQKNLIWLSDQADLSSLLHETGHMFLFQLMKDAADPRLKASAQPKYAQMVSSTRKWLSENVSQAKRDLASMKKDLKQRIKSEKDASRKLMLENRLAAVERINPDSDHLKAAALAFMDPSATGHDADAEVLFHELWARGFEKYLGEGKAPSAGLKRAFQKFSSWMVSVYRQLKNLNVNLSPDIRDVFDRLVATEEAIDAERSRPLYKVPSEILEFATDAEAAALARLADEAELEANSILQQRTAKELHAEEREKRANRRSELEDSITAEVRAEPIYAATNIARDGVMPDGQEIGSKAMDKAEVVALIGKVRAEALPVGVATKGTKGGKAIPASDVAALTGYETAQDMLEAITEQHRAEADEVNMRVEAAMAEEFGAATSPLQLAEYAVAAVQNDKFADLQALQLRILRRMASSTVEKVARREAEQKGAPPVAKDKEAQAEAAALTGPEAQLAKVKADVQRRVNAGHRRAQSAGKKTVAGIKRGLDPAAINAAADKFVENLEVAQATPQRYRAAADRLTTKINKAIAGRDYTAAASYMEQRALLLAVSKRVAEFQIKAQRDIKKWRDKTRRLDKKLAASYDVDHVNAIRMMLNPFDMAPASSKNYPAAEALAKLQHISEELYQDLTSAVDKWINRGAGLTGKDRYKNLTVLEFKQMISTADTLLSNSRDAHSTLVEGRRINHDQVASEINIKADNNLSVTKREQKGKQRFRGTATFRNIETARRSIRGSLRIVQSWARVADNGDAMGPVQQYLLRPVLEAVNKYQARRAVPQEMMIDAIKGRKDLMAKQDIDAPELDGWKFTSKGQLIMFMLNMGNASNKHKMLLGGAVDTATGQTYQWGTVDGDGNLDSTAADAFVSRMFNEGVITKADMDFVQEVWNIFETTKGAAQQAHYRMFGYYFTEIEAEPVQTPFGQYAGGYIPMMYDGLMNPDVAKFEDALISSTTGNAAMFPAVESGFTKGRVDAYAKPADLAIEKLPMHLDRVMRFAYLAPAIRSAALLVTNPKVAAAINRISPDFVNLGIVPWLHVSASQQVTTPTKANQFAHKFAAALNRRVGQHLMAGNIRNAAEQLTGFAPAALRVGYGNVARAMTQWRVDGQSARKHISERSEFMRERLMFSTNETMHMLGEILSEQSTLSPTRAFIDKYAYYAQQVTQNVIDPVVWLAAERKGMDTVYQPAYDDVLFQTDGDIEAADAAGMKAVVFFADQVVSETQASMRASDIANVNIGTPMHRLFVKFFQFFSAMSNLGMTEVQIAWNNANIGWGHKMGRSFHAYIATLAVPSIVSAMLGALASGKFDTDDDEELAEVWLEVMVGSQIKATAASVPYAGPVALTVYGLTTDAPYDDRLSMGASIGVLESTVSNTAKLVMQIADPNTDPDTARAIRTAMDAFALTTGIPTNWLAKPLSYAAKVHAGEADPDGLADLIQGALTGRDGTE